MPLLNSPDMISTAIDGTGYDFSAVRVTDVEASEVTLVTIAIDHSGSTTGFFQEAEAALRDIVQACSYSPRAGNLMLRVVKFNHQIEEVHGFKMLSACNPDDYTGIALSVGGTALYDAVVNAVESVARYGKELYDNGLDVNGIVFVITDGLENGNSQVPLSRVKESVQEALREEALESLRTILIGLKINSNSDARLQQFKNEAGFDQFVPVQDASAKALARLADFVSQSIVSQSQALGTGGPSQALTF